MELLAKLFLNSLYGEQIREYIVEQYACKSEYWRWTENDERVTRYCSIGNIEFIVKLAEDEGKEVGSNKANVMPLHLSASVLSNSRRTMNNFIEAIGWF